MSVLNNRSNLYLIKQILSRQLSLTSIAFLKEIRLTKKDDRTTIVEGVKVESNRTDKLVKPPSSSNEKACPLCRLNLRRLTYTDVLILNQFVESDGRIMPRSVTGLCNRQYNKVTSLVRLAQRSQLMPRPNDYVIYGPWESLNTYSESFKRSRDQPINIIKPEYWR